MVNSLGFSLDINAMIHILQQILQIHILQQILQIFTENVKSNKFVLTPIKLSLNKQIKKKRKNITEKFHFCLKV